MQSQADIGIVRIMIEMLDAIGVERAAAADDAVNFVSLFEQEFRQIRAILAGNARDQSFFSRAGIHQVSPNETTQQGNGRCSLLQQSDRLFVAEAEEDLDR
jgi:hypothetical protein